MIGDRLLQYHVLSRLGAGGMGEVYLAEDERLGRKVALKFLSADLVNDEQALERFRNEARLSAGLSHPNIASIHGFEEADGRWFHVHEYVEGDNLEDILRRGQVSVDTARAVAIDIARGLAHAHARGVIHRDLKPANVIVTPEGVAKILDFGLARRSGAAGPTLPGVALGTVAYMSPEQLQGGTIDHRSDLWAFGALLYEVLTGQSPFAAPQIPAQLQRILNEEPTPVEKLRPDVPADLRGIIEMCLRKDPRDRFATAEEILAGLGLTVDLRRPASGAALPRRKPVWFGIGTAVVVVVAVALGFFFMRGEPPTTEAIAETVTVQDEFGETTTQSVPNPVYRKRATLFFAESVPAGEEWLAYGLPHLINVDLSQDPFVVAQTPFYFVELTRREGSTDGRGLSRALQRKIAHERSSEIFVTYEVDRSSEGALELTQVVHETESGKVLASHTTTGGTIFEIADRASVALRDDLRIPEVLVGDYPDLPVSEISTDSEEACRSLVDATLALTIDNDYGTASERLDAAVAADSTFALAHMSSFVVRSFLQDFPGLTESAELAMRYLYRLPPKARFAMKANYYMNIEQQPDKALAVTRMWTQLHPEDEDAFRQLAAFHMYRGESEEQVAALEQVLRIDPADFATLEMIGSTYREMGSYDDAEQWLQRFVDTYPKRTSGRIELARVYIDSARRDRAREELEQAILLEARDPVALRVLAQVDMRDGRLDDARDRLRDALRVAATALERADVHDDLSELLERQGRILEAQEEVDATRIASAEALAPTQVTIRTLVRSRLFALRGQTDAGLEFARGERASLAPQVRGAAALGLVPLFIEADQPDSARVYVEELADFVDTYKLELIRPAVLRFEAEVAELEQDFSTALARLDAAAELRPPGARDLRMRARLLRELDRLEEAEQAGQRALDLDPHHPASLVEHARLMLALERPDEAQEALESALQVWADADANFVRKQEAEELLRFVAQGR